jgi:galactose mutarotase-like enzyme
LSWDLIEHGASALELGVRWSEELKKDYPFEWSLNARFELKARKLIVSYEISNCSADDDLWFSLGSHPAFNLDFGSDAIEDYYLNFRGSEEPLLRRKLSASGLSRRTFPTDWDGSKIHLTQSIFDEDALVFTDVDIDSIEISSESTDRRITINTGMAPDLGIWSKPNAPFVCIEPWFGLDDFEDHDGFIQEKAGIQNLPAGGVFKTAYTVEPNSAWWL